MAHTNDTYGMECRYMNPLTDYGFKRIFGEKDIMMAFLNDLLNLPSPIEDIEFLDKEVADEWQEVRGVVYDLRCMTADGKEFIVEMQNKGQQYFSNRIIYYLSRSISTQARKGKDNWDFELHPVYGVFFMNFHMAGLQPLPVRTVQLKVEETGEVFTDNLKVFTLELPEFRGKPTEFPKSAVEYWLYNLANMETMTTSLPFEQQQPIFRKVGGISELVRMSESDRLKYNISLDTYRTNLAVMKNERAEGIAEGRVMGIAEGRMMGITASAVRMKRMGLPINIIQECSGLTPEEIDAL